jgi:hypothetical protein
MKTSIVAVCLAVLLRSACQAGEDEDRKAFEERYATWKTWVGKNLVSSDLSASKEFFSIAELGPSVIPFVVEKIETNPDDYDFALVGVISRLTGYWFKLGEWPENEPGDERFDFNKRRVLTYIRWWKKGRFKTGERFTEQSAEWHKLQGAGKTEEAEKAFRRIVYLGTPVLPYLIEHVEKAPEFVVAISRLTTRWDGGMPTNATPSECKAWWEQNKARYELPPLRDTEKEPQSVTSPTNAPPAFPPSATPASRFSYAVPLAVGAGLLATLFLWRGVRRKKP